MKENVFEITNSNFSNMPNSNFDDVSTGSSIIVYAIMMMMRAPDKTQAGTKPKISCNGKNTEEKNTTTKYKRPIKIAATKKTSKTKNINNQKPK